MSALPERVCARAARLLISNPSPNSLPRTASESLSGLRSTAGVPGAGGRSLRWRIWVSDSGLAGTRGDSKAQGTWKYRGAGAVLRQGLAEKKPKGSALGWAPETRAPSQGMSEEVPQENRYGTSTAGPQGRKRASQPRLDPVGSSGAELHLRVDRASTRELCAAPQAASGGGGREEQKLTGLRASAEAAARRQATDRRGCSEQVRRGFWGHLGRAALNGSAARA